MTTAKIEPPHVYAALGAILKHMQVEKGGTLPSNMGSGKYIAAPALTEEVKRQLVANDLIILSNETVISQEALVHKDRINIRVVIHGDYTFVSLRDGSEAKISGTGDGLAIATAVSSNIASTNALKNALLRTLLVSEESVEEASLNGTEGGKESATQRKIDKTRAAKPAAKKTVSKTDKGPGPARDVIRTAWIDSEKVSRETVNDLMKTVKSENENLKGDAVYEEMLKRLEAGEVG